MSKKEMLRDYEKEQLDRIRGLGLVHRVAHEQYRKPAKKKIWNDETKQIEVIDVTIPDPRPIHTETGTVMVVGETYVSLYHLNDGVKGRELEKEVPVGIGFSWCSHKDTFDRRIGRVKAMDRAIKSLLNCEASNNARIE
jgi:hypothetical protein